MLRTWGPRVLLAIGVALAAWGLYDATNRAQEMSSSATYLFTHADLVRITAGIVVGVVALTWNAWEWWQDKRAAKRAQPQ